MHHGRGSVLLHDVTTDDGEHRAAVFIRSPGTVSVLEAGKNIELRPLNELEPFPEHPRDYEPKDDVVRRCARNKYAGSFPVVRESGEILNGHKRVTAARRAGLDHHPVEVVAVTDDQARELYKIAHRGHDHDSGDTGDEEPGDQADGEDLGTCQRASVGLNWCLLFHERGGPREGTRRGCRRTRLQLC